MNDDEVLPDAPPIEVAPETPTPAATKADRRKFTIDRTAGAVNATNPDGSLIGNYAVADLPPEVRAYLELDGLRAALRAGDPTETYRELMSGIVTTPRVAAPSGLDPWREAYAYAVADTEAKTRQIQKSRGGKETPEYADILSEARKKARDLSKDAMRKIRTVAAVVAHHERITGVSVSLADLA